MPMQLLLIALVLGLFIHDAYVEVGGGGSYQLPTWAVLSVAVIPKLALMAWYGWACRRALRRAQAQRDVKPLIRLARLTDVYTTAALPLYAVDLVLGWLTLVRHTVGDLVLIDELLVMSPTLVYLLWQPWAYYAVEARAREAAIWRLADAGRPIYPVPTRGRYLANYLRHHVGLVLLPLLAIYAWHEAVLRLGERGVLNEDWQAAAALAGAAMIFVSAPVAIRYLWDTTPLPEGEVRRRMRRLCASHRVRVAELLLWRTGGATINAAVLGVLPPLRYILLSDALLDAVEPAEVEAVMAHEIGHVRKRHAVWLLLAAGGTLAALQLAAGSIVLTTAAGLDAMGDWYWRASLAADELRRPQTLMLLTLAAAGVGWVLTFGWVSRRVERQADAFAVRHLARRRRRRLAARGEDAGPAVVDSTSAGTMINALGRIAELNQMPTAKRQWRHGSIAWRQNYLRTLIGQPLDALPIDRQMRLIAWGSGAAAMAVVAVMVWMES